jgi:hypothetical protein
MQTRVCAPVISIQHVWRRPMVKIRLPQWRFIPYDVASINRLRVYQKNIKFCFGGHFFLVLFFFFLSSPQFQSFSLHISK